MSARRTIIDSFTLNMCCSKMLLLRPKFLNFDLFFSLVKKSVNVLRNLDLDNEEMVIRLMNTNADIRVNDFRGGEILWKQKI